MNMINFGPVIPAVRTEEDFEAALLSDAQVIFDLSPDLLTISSKVKKAHYQSKKLFIHLDLATGIGKDESGIKYIKSLGVDGILSTRVNIIRLARENELFTVQRFFAVDSQSIETTASALKNSKADTIEIMPGVLPKVIKKLKDCISVPIIAGGLIDSAEEVHNALENGASSISTGIKELWRIK